MPPLIDGARWWQLIRHIYLPLSKPALIAFAIVSVTSHWNEFLWPLMVINSPDKRPLTVGLADLHARGRRRAGLGRDRRRHAHRDRAAADRLRRCSSAASSTPS